LLSLIILNSRRLPSWPPFLLRHRHRIDLAQTPPRGSIYSLK
jgi:hypothetical protein